MKKIIVFAVLLFTGFSFQTKAQDYYDRGYDNSYNYNGYNNDGFGYFYTSLSPYGSWIEFGDGVYGWKPFHMNNIWAPYSDGRWIWTSDGWYWDSYEPFGYIVYHYGRWYYDDYYGWIWIPDYQWAPAWVDWRYDNDYIGWAPLPPYALFSISVGIHFTHVYSVPYAHWHFVQYHYFCDPYVGKYFVGAKYKYRIYSNTKYRHDYGWRDGRVINRGVGVDMVRQRGKVDIRERNIRTVSNLRDINDRNRVSDNEVRTFIPDKKNFTGARVKDVKIERTKRNTSLETSKLEFGRTNLERKDVKGKTNIDSRNREVNKEKSGISTDRNSNGNINRKSTDQKKIAPRNETGKTERKQTEKPVQKTQDRKDPRTLAPSRTETKQQVDMRKSEIIKDNNRKDSRTLAPTKTDTKQETLRKNNKMNTRTVAPLRTEMKQQTELRKSNPVENNNRMQSGTGNTQVQKRNDGGNGNVSRSNSGDIRVQRQGNRGNDRSQRK